MLNINEKKLGYLEMVAAMVVMGTVGIFVVESEQSAYNVVFFRCVFGAISLAIYCYLRGFFTNTNLNRKTLTLAILSGIFLVFNWVMLFASFKFATISTSTVIYHTQPFFFLIIGAIVFHEKISLEKIICMVVAFFGVILITDIKENPFAISSQQWLGIIFPLSAAVLWAITAIIVKKLSNIKPHLIALLQVSIGIFVLYPFITTQEIATTNISQWSFLIILGVIHTCITYILMYSAFHKLPTVVIGVLTFIYPAVAIIADFVFYDILLTLVQVIGVVLIFASSFAVNQNVKFLYRKK